MRKWEIWYAKVRWSKRSQDVKERPVLMIGRTEEKYVVLEMKGKGSHSSYKVGDWVAAGLGKETHIETYRPIMIDKKAFQRSRMKKLGKLQESDISGLREHTSIQRTKMEKLGEMVWTETISASPGQPSLRDTLAANQARAAEHNKNNPAPAAKDKPKAIDE